MTTEQDNIEQESTIEEILKVEIVDALMTCFRNSVQPTDDLVARACRYGINADALKTYVEEIEYDSTKDEEEY